jgi:hypothetical protein
MLFALVYSAKDPFTEVFVRLTLAEDTVCSLLGENFVCWAARIGDSDARVLTKEAGITVYPALVVLTFRPPGKWLGLSPHHHWAHRVVASVVTAGMLSILCSLSSVLSFQFFVLYYLLSALSYFSHAPCPVSFLPLTT